MFDTVQERRATWVARMFPDAPTHHGILGATEELGEWAEAETEEDAVDAIADVAIWLISWCQSRKLPIPEPRPFFVDNFGKQLTICIGQIARCELKMQQTMKHGVEPRYKGRDFEFEARDAVARAFHVLYLMAQNYNRELEALVTATWNEIERRTR